MTKELIPEDHSRRTEIVRGHPVAISSYRLGARYYAKAEIDIIGAGARIGAGENTTRERAESKAVAEARRAIEKKA